MPSKTPAQHRAMEAAAHGKSTVGIPKKVGKEFVQADKGKKVSTSGMAAALRKKRPAPVDPEAEAMECGGYDPRHGVGSG